MVKNPKNRVNGCTLDKKGKIIRIHYEGNLYLDTKTGLLTNPYKKDLKDTLDGHAIEREIRRAEHWRLVWDNRSAT